jgi:hypothetical protein
MCMIKPITELNPINLQNALKDDFEFWEALSEMLECNPTDTPDTHMGKIIKGYTEVCAIVRGESLE